MLGFVEYGYGLIMSEEGVPSKLYYTVDQDIAFKAPSITVCWQVFMLTTEQAYAPILEIFQYLVLSEAHGSLEVAAIPCLTGFLSSTLLPFFCTRNLKP